MGIAWYSKFRVWESPNPEFMLYWTYNRGCTFFLLLFLHKFFGCRIIRSTSDLLKNWMKFFQKLWFVNVASVFWWLAIKSPPTFMVALFKHMNEKNKIPKINILIFCLMNLISSKIWLEWSQKELVSTFLYLLRKIILKSSLSTS